MKSSLVAVGKRMPGWVNEGFKEYNKRLPKDLRLHLIEVTPVNRSKTGSERNFIKEEDKRIRAAIPNGSLVIVLDDNGKHFTSLKLARNLEDWRKSGKDITFVIGGADGLHDTFIKEADLIWSLSGLTLPHTLVRIVLAEQIYRAWSITQNHPYHRE
jgi:23S rRNA (pseudouridine1915-N3)-methyltransferase